MQKGCIPIAKWLLIYINSYRSACDLDPKEILDYRRPCLYIRKKAAEATFVKKNEFC